MRNLTLPITLAALALVPATTLAAPVTFGHRLDHEPSNSAPGHPCSEDNPSLSCTRIPNDGDRGGAVAAGMTAPAKGTITKFKVRAGAPGDLTFVVVKRKGDFAKARHIGPAVHVQGLGFEEDERDAVETFKAKVKVKKGDYVGIESTSTSALYCSHGGDTQLLYSPVLRDAFSTASDTDSCELLVQAVMKKG